MSDDTQTMLRKHLDATSDHLTELWTKLDSDEARESSMYEDDVRTELHELPLALTWEKGEPFAVVLGTGGPHIEITGGGREGGYTLHGYWGSESAKLHSHSITRTGEYFRDYVESLD